MKEYIKKLQAKDEGARKRIVFAYMVVSVILVVGIWAYDLGSRFDRLSQKEQKPDQEVVAKEEGKKPLSIFKDSLVNTYRNITASIGNAPSLSKVKGGSGDETGSLPEGKQIDLIVVN